MSLFPGKPAEWRLVPETAEEGATVSLIEWKILKGPGGTERELWPG